MSEHPACLQSFPSVKIYSVSELSTSIKLFIEANFESVKLRGEVQACKVHTSGHVYLTLKDENSIIDAICWKGTYLKAATKLEDGMEIVCNCKVTTYPMRSKYQVVINSYEIAGEGALLKVIEERKKRLSGEGVFANNRKIPFLPKLIGIITSETGAVIRDIMHRIQDRNPNTDVIVWPVLVQGEGAAAQIICAINGFNTLSERPDVLIIARGGGSVEDLMPFNDEGLARAIYQSRIPIVSAVGHETDTTIADFAADLRAPTPTAAAELVVPVRDDLLTKLSSIVTRMTVLLDSNLKKNAYMLEALFKSLPSIDTYLCIKEQSLDYLIEKFRTVTLNYSQKYDQALSLLGFKLESYSYQNTLKRGFALVKCGESIAKSVSDLSDHAKLILYDGEALVTVDQKIKKIS